jgi:hypothetical protein
MPRPDDHYGPPDGLHDEFDLIGFYRHPDTRGMSAPVRCRTCGEVYDSGKVEVTARYVDCSVWTAPCCGRIADSRDPEGGITKLYR